ncbi:MAG: tripartite tricarboxylate transporter permease [Candidatus Thermoplasmatota archaeon]|nr:tripartite tricarboxylate transporter permease [Candidatus Thermoplasmatota archaeon]
MLDMFFIIFFCILGVLIGFLTGLIPGLHVNNVALILVSTASSIIALCSPLHVYGLSEHFIIIVIAGFIISLAIAHSFVNTIPGTFIGAPDEDSALSILPAHSLLLEGEGYKAVALSAIGSYGAIVFCLALFIPLRFFIGPPLSLYTVLQETMVWVLLAIVILMIATEKTRITEFGHEGALPSILGILFAVLIFFLSGFFGLIILDFPLVSLIGLPASVLFPALAGLFGVPTLLSSLFTKPQIPKQKQEQFLMNPIEKKVSVVSVITGSIAGVIVSIIPGVTTAIGTVLAMTLRQRSSREQTIVTLSAVNTAAAFCVTLMLFLIQRTRSGVMIAVDSILAVDPWTSTSMPVELTYFLMFLVLGGTISYYLTLTLGKLFARNFHKIPYRFLVVLTLLFLGVLIVLFTGLLGLFVLFTATSIGFLPLCWGVRRSHCMGVLMVPIILYFL